MNDKDNECPKCRDFGTIYNPSAGFGARRWEYCDCMASLELQAIGENHRFDDNARDSTLRAHGYSEAYEDNAAGDDIYCLYKNNIPIIDIPMYIIELEKRIEELEGDTP